MKTFRKVFIGKALPAAFYKVLGEICFLEIKPGILKTGNF
jgi:hypothetical protein